ELGEAGVPILELGVRSFASGSAATGARRVGAYLKAQHIDLVHAVDVPLDIFSVTVGRWFCAQGVRCRPRADGAVTRGLTRRMLRFTDRIADGIVVNSQAVARELSGEDGVPASKVRLVYNGVDTSRFQPEGERATLPWQNGVAIGVVCALRPEKGLNLL